MTFNVDTIMASALAAVIVIGLAFVLKAKVTSGKPNTVQIYFETITVQMRQQIEQGIGMKIAGFVLPLAVTLFTYILIANWIGVIPWQYGSTNDEGESVAHEVLMTPSGDVNFVYAMALFVFVWYHAAASSAAASSGTRSSWSGSRHRSGPDQHHRRDRQACLALLRLSATCSPAARCSR